MAETTIAQSEQLLKSLKQSLQEICKRHEIVRVEFEDFSNRMLDHFNITWSEALYSIPKIEQLESMCFEIKKDTK